MGMSEQNRANPLELVELIKCIIEYYAFKVNTSSGEDKEIEEQMKSIMGTNQFTLPEIPGNIDKAIEKSFLAQLKHFEK